MPQPKPSPITPLLPLHVGGSDQNAIFSANGAPIGRCNYASEAAAIVHACNTLPKLEEEKARLRLALEMLLSVIARDKDGDYLICREAENTVSHAFTVFREVQP